MNLCVSRLPPWQGTLRRNIIDLNLSRVCVVSIALGACGLSTSRAQTASVKVPPDQWILTSILSKYNQLYDNAPNDIVKRKIDPQYREEFCAHVPASDVKGWIGTVWSINDRGPDKSLKLDLSVSTVNAVRGSYGGILIVENHDGYGVSKKNTAPHEITTIPVGSPLYDIAASLREGDVIRFNATFVPYWSPQDCYDNTSLVFAMVKYNSIQKLGYHLRLE